MNKRFAASLSHPGIARVYDYGESAEFGGAYLVMELVNGEPLSAILARAGRLSADATLDIVSRVREELHLLRNHIPHVATRVVETFVVENFAHVVWELPIDVEIDPEVEVVDMRLVLGMRDRKWVQHATHGDARMDSVNYCA